VNLDLEGVDGDGGFWVASEGSGTIIEGSNIMNMMEGKDIMNMMIESDDWYQSQYAQCQNDDDANEVQENSENDDRSLHALGESSPSARSIILPLCQCIP
jgi:hypothetical protein